MKDTLVTVSFKPPNLRHGPALYHEQALHHESALLEGYQQIQGKASFRDLLHFGPEQDAFWRRIRAAHVAYVQKQMALGIMSFLVNMLVWLMLFATVLPIYVWALLFCTQILAGHAWIKQRAQQRQAEASVGVERKRVIIALLKLTGFGSCWGFIFYFLITNAVSSHLPVILVQSLIVLTLGALVTSIFFWGMIGFCTTFSIGLIAGLLVRPPEFVGAMLLLFGLYLVVIFRSSFISAMAFMTGMRAQDQFIEQGEMVRLLLNEFEVNGQEWLFEFDTRGRLTFASQRFADAAECSINELLGCHWTEIGFDLDSGDIVFENVRRSQPFRNLTIKVQVNGENRWWMISGTPKYDAEGKLTGYRGVGMDVSESQRAVERIEELASYDTLTGLANRRVIHQALVDGLARPQGVSLLFIDLDRFKAVNDSLGHGAGDQLLTAVSSRLKEVTMDRLGERALIGRLGGDEFAVVLNSSDHTAASALGEAIISRLSEPYYIEGKQALIGASVGLAVGPQDGDTVEALMRAADLALYDVKDKERGQVRVFSGELRRRASDRLLFEQALRVASARNQLYLEFQPIVNALDERVVGFEALMRWKHPEYGNVPPVRFIPIAEDTGLIHHMGIWALNEACRVAATWSSDIKIAVNLSPMQFDDPNFASHVREALRAHNLAPGRLELELTESLFLDDRPQITQILDELQEIGVKFALDDFGTGYASLGYLRKIAFSRLKIDRSFIRDISSSDNQSTTIVQAIVALAERLGMQTTAEGAETRAEFETVRRLGCAQVQGYYFGRPMSEKDAARLLYRMRPLIDLYDPSPKFPAVAGQGQLKVEDSSSARHEELSGLLLGSPSARLPVPQDRS